MTGVMHEADHAYSIRSTWWLHRLATNVPSIACVINWQSIFVYNLDLSNFLLESGLSYFDFYLSVSCWSILWVLQDVTALICMSLMGFSAWWTIDPRGYLKSCNFSFASLYSKIEGRCIFFQFTSRIDWKWNWGLASHFFIQFLIAKGTKKRNAPNAAQKGGGGEWAAAAVLPNQG